VDEEVAERGPGRRHAGARADALAAGLAAALALVGAVGCDERASAPAPLPSAPVAAPAPPPAPPPPPAFVASDLPRVDVHVHVEPGALSRAVALLGAQHIVHLVNLSGGDPGHGLEETIAEARAVGHTTVFTDPDFREVRRGGNYGARLAAAVKAAHALGARGVKITKGLGLGYIDGRGQLVPVDDKGLDPMFEAAGKLGMPIAIHTGDPKAFWRPPTPDNERFDELRVHPRWSFFGAPVSWDDLYAQFERRVARHPRTTFIGVHFGNDPEDPARVAQMLDRHKNLYIDTAARIPEIGRVDANHDARRMRAFFERYRDRILFGTDVGVGEGPDDLMLGSTGATPPGPADVRRFFESSWRWFETEDREIPSPTPIQGRWSIDGIGLPREILELVYSKNAMRVIGIAPESKSP
jgi:predicted TIM-barrel fold metal-dependent hydrolase